MTEQPGRLDVDAPDVGLYLDDDCAVAAVSHPIAPGPSLHLASLHSTVLNTHSDGTVSLGDTTDGDSEAYTQFLDSLADGVGVAGSRGTVFPAEQLASMALLCLLTEVASSIGLRPGDLAAAATYPARWTADQVFALRSAMNAHGLDHVSLVAEAQALDAWNSSIRASLQKKDAAAAIARGAAILASRFPVDAVTERIAVLSPPRPDRRPLFAAAAFAAALTVGAALVALQLGSAADTTVPTIGNAQLAPTTTSAGAVPAGPIDFPTVVIEPAAEIVPAPARPAETSFEPSPTETVVPPRTEEAEKVEAPEIATRPATESADDTAPDGPERGLAPDIEEAGDAGGTDGAEDPADPAGKPTDESAENPASEQIDGQPATGPAARETAQRGTAPADRSTGDTP